MTYLVNSAFLQFMNSVNKFRERLKIKHTTDLTWGIIYLINNSDESNANVDEFLKTLATIFNKNKVDSIDLKKLSHLSSKMTSSILSVKNKNINVIDIYKKLEIYGKL